MKKNQIVTFNYLINKIYIIREQKVMLDKDLAEIYGVETRRLNEQVKRNISRFPTTFMFQLNNEEYNFLRSQNATLEKTSLRSQNTTIEDQRGKHRKYLPHVFTEHGAVMLASILKSDTAIQASIRVVQAFVEMRKYISTNFQLFLRMDMLEQKVLRTEEKVDLVYKAFEDSNIKPKQGIFYNGQVFDAYTFVADLIRRATTSIVLIDNYIDDSVLTLFTKRKENVSLVIYTGKISKQLELDLKKHNEQYPVVEVRIFKESHDRFLIIDQKELYHLGSSLKDLGKKWFAFSKMEIAIIDMLKKL